VSQDLLTGTTLRQRARNGVADEHVRSALRSVTDRLADMRVDAQESLTNWEELRDAARAMRGHIVARLPEILDRLASNVEASGGTVFWAADAAEATAYIAGVARDRGVKRVVKSKSMVTEEIHLNDVLQADGIEVVETDLGEWIIQLAQQMPSHILAPAIHMTRGDVADLFNRVADGDLSDVPEELCAFAREQLRNRFLTADLGISGCNFGVAETGSTILVTNEGNGRMVTTLPPVHIAVMGMERVVETWEQLDLMMNLLPRAASGQDISVYVSQVTGARRVGELDGPEQFHLVILDNGRSDLLGSEYQEMLNCIRCGACLNVCPVYRQMGGHGYGWVYSGPMGAVLTPLLNRQPEAAELSSASTLCSACYDACPVKIPLQDLLLGLRRDRADEAGRAERATWDAWAAAWSRPGAYRTSVRMAGAMGRILPAGLFPTGWTAGREVPRRPDGGSFRRRFAKGDI